MTVPTVRLPGTGLEVSQLCLGTAAFSASGGPDWTIRDADRCLAIVDRALECGINFLDTANIYGGGESEQLVGEAIAGRREEVVLASKVGKRTGRGPNRVGLSRSHVYEAIEDTLARLDTDYLDLYYIHQWDPHTSIDELVQTLDALVADELVRYIGASNLLGWQLAAAIERAERYDRERFVCVQPEYNLVARHEEANLLPVAAAYDVGVCPYAPLAAGFLATADPDEEPPTYRDLSVYDSQERCAVRTIVTDLATQRDVSPVEVSVAWLLTRPIVTAPIVGPRTVEQLETYVAALDISLTDAEIARLEAPIEPVWNRQMMNWDWTDGPFELA